MSQAQGSHEEPFAHVAERQRLCSDVKKLIVDRLALDLNPEWITNDQPLFGRGLELDSVDSLELALAIEDEFGLVDGLDDPVALATVNALVDLIQHNGARNAAF